MSIITSKPKSTRHSLKQQQFKNLKNSSNPLRNKYPDEEKPKRTLKKHRIEQRVRKERERERERVTDSGSINRVGSNEFFNIGVGPRWDRLFTLDETGIVLQERKTLGPEFLEPLIVILEERL